MPKYILESTGLITLRAEVEAATPELALAEGKKLESNKWEACPDSTPTPGEITFITEYGEDEAVREFEVSEGEVHEMWLNSAGTLTTRTSSKRTETARGYASEHLTIADLIKLPADDELIEENRKHTKNKEGLTFKEWLSAAGIWYGGDLEPLPIGAAYDAWRWGGDPTDWKAESNNGEVIK
jgi:hypothetical protein